MSAQCMDCGQHKMPCCEKEICNNNDLKCTNHYCEKAESEESCSKINDKCCKNNTCNGGLTCKNDRCEKVEKSQVSTTNVILMGIGVLFLILIIKK